MEGHLVSQDVLPSVTLFLVALMFGSGIREPVQHGLSEDF